MGNLVTSPLFRSGQWVRRTFKGGQVRSVMIEELCRVPDAGGWRYWYAYTRENRLGVTDFHLAVADESELTS